MTLLFALALPSIADKWPTTFGGDQGLTTTVPTAPGSLERRGVAGTGSRSIGALVVMVLLANLSASRFGRSFRAVRDDEIAASLAGDPRGAHQGDGLRRQRRRAPGWAGHSSPCRPEW